MPAWTHGLEHFAALAELDGQTVLAALVAYLSGLQVESMDEGPAYPLLKLSMPAIALSSAALVSCGRVPGWLLLLMTPLLSRPFRSRSRD